MIQEELNKDHGQEHENDLVANRGEHAPLLYFEVRSDPLSNQIVAVNVVAIREVVDVVSRDRVYSIVESTHVCSFARASKVCF